MANQVDLDGVSVAGGESVATEELADGRQLPVSVLATTDGSTFDLVDESNPLPVSPAGLVPPVGGSVTGDDAAHALGSLTGAGFVVLINEGPGLVTVGDASTQTAPLPVGSYSYRSASVGAIRVYVPTGTTARYLVHLV